MAQPPAIHDRPQGVLHRLETFAGGVIMALATMPGFLFLGVSEDPNAPENPIFRLYWPPIYGIILLLCVVRWRDLARCWVPALLAAVLVGWAFFSTTWSVLPDVTVRRAIAFTMITLFGLYLGAAWAPGRMVRALAVAFAALAFLSALTALGAPRLGVEHEGELAGNWRGVWSSKNALAEYMVIGAIAGLAAAVLAPAGRRWPWLAMTTLCTALLLMSQGKTSLLCLLLAAAVLATLLATRRGPLWAVLAAFLAGTIVLWGGLFAWARPDLLLKALGKDPTLTGRTPIWSAVLRQMEGAPWIGYGYGAFWERESLPGRIVRKEARWLVPSAHNGWLDLVVQVGAIGVILFAAVLLVLLLAHAWRLHRLQDGHFGTMYLVFYLLISLSESVLEPHNSLAWALFVTVLTMTLRPAARAAVPRERPALRAERLDDIPWPEPSGG